jgi:hypothetical protein
VISVRSVQSFWSFFVSLPFDEMIKGEVLKYIVVGKSRNSRIIPGETSIQRKNLICDLVRFLFLLNELLSKYLYET